MNSSDLIEFELIKRLKYAYFRFLDQKRWDEIRSLFVPEATAAYSGGKYSYDGRDAIVEFLTSNMGRDAFHSSHRVHHPELTITGRTGDEASTATGIWAMDDVNVDTEFDFYLTGAGFYEDTYVKHDGDWRFSHTGYRRTFETIQSLSKSRISVTASWWTTQGQSTLEVQ